MRFVELLPEHDGALTFASPQKSDVMPVLVSKRESQLALGDKVITTEAIFRAADIQRAFLGIGPLTPPSRVAVGFGLTT